ncbi:hypothetical protein DOS84_07425 [Flavobacterium aquariorum]|uniref:HYR domain-containing protein n=1 Tax=Flavobacterium aquariorum TaxID=2217670 RepID=A0A2W7VQR3_9FLAO|nr:HYR domain-containing protein [Flavobacterium aquariorum]PZX94442.1 hypothetical protein DOS84_07425 [Flavobacterium aquariorum]
MKTFLPKSGIFAIVFLIANLFFVSSSFGQNTGLLSPTTSLSVSSVINVGNGLASDNAYAVFDANGDTGDYGGFNISIPAGATILGIEVQLEGNRPSGGGRDVTVQLTWNNKTNFTATKTITAFGTTDALRTVGSPSDTWGHSPWALSEFGNGIFFARVASTGGGGTINLDQVLVRVYYCTQPTITASSTAAVVCFSASSQTTTLAYTATTNSPTSYSIAWTGMANQSSTAFAFNAAGGTITGITIPASTAAGTYNGTMTIANAGGCTSTTPISVTVNALPTANAGAALSPICQGGTSAALGGSVGGTATGGTWSDGGIGGTFSPGDTDLNATWTPPPGYSGTATLTLTSSGGLCGTKTASKTQVVNIQPTALAGETQTICSNKTAIINGTALNGTIVWTVDGGATVGTLDNPNIESPVFTPDQYFEGTATLTMTVTNAGCIAVSVTSVVIVNGGAATVDPGTNVTVCMTTPGEVPLSGIVGGGASSGTWSGGNGTFFPNNSDLATSYTPTQAEIDLGSVTLTLTSEDPGGLCPGAVSRSKTITFKKAPIATAGGSTSICPGGSAIVSGATSSNGTILWTHNGSGSLSNANTLTPTYTSVVGDAGNTVTLTLTVSNSPCPDATATYTVVVNPLPVSKNLLGTGTICSGSSTDIQVVDSEYDFTLGIQYQLRNNSNNAAVGIPVSGTGATINLPTGILTNSTANPITFTFNVLATNLNTNCSVQMANVVTITVNPAPLNRTITGPAGAICTGSTATITVGTASASVNGTTYQLRNNADNSNIVGSTVTISNTSTASFSLSTLALTSTTTFNVLATINATGCTAQMSGTPTVTVNSLISNNTITSDQSICSGTAPAGLVGSTPTGGNGTYTYLWEQSTNNDTGTGTWANASITNGASASRTLQNYTPPQTPPSTVTTWYRRTVTSAPCGASISPAVKITVNPLPTVYAVTGGGAYCEGGAGMPIGLSNSQTGVNYQLYLGASPDGPAVAGTTGSAITFGNKTVAGTYTVVATATYNITTNCSSNMTGSATITVNPVPVTVGASVCLGESGGVLTSSCPNPNVSVGPKDPVTGASAAGAGTAWTNPTRVVLDDASYATAATTFGGGAVTTNSLQATNFDFSAIPNTATILGIQISIKRFSSVDSFSDFVRDNTVSLMKAGVVAGSNYANTGTNWLVANTTVISYGGASDLWGTTWTPTDIKTVNFGVALSANIAKSGFNVNTASVDNMKITVYYLANGVLNWYTASSGGTLIGTGSPFNPVGVLNSGLPDTNTAGTTSFYAECTSVPGCRTKTDFVVKPLPTMTCPSNSSVCVDAAAYELTGASPAGGTYSGTGVSANNFNPATAGVGPHTITYSYTDVGNGCSNSCSFTITVNALPTLTCPSNSSVCVDAAPYALTGASPEGGTYSGTGVSSNNFDPATAGVGLHTITYSYTDGNGCSNSCTFTITVNPLPIVTCPSDSSVCVDAVAYELTGASPAGGTYSGTGVSANNFDPATAGVGLHTITYSYTDGNGCSNSCTFTVTVNPLPTVSCPSDSSVCLNAAAYELTGASPAGGTYSGTGVSANNFDPATAGVGPHTITYSYTDGNGCSNSCTFTITVNTLPTVSCPSDSSVCVDAAAYALTGASPAGGTYSGTGVSANNFDPATAGVGQHTITYTYTEEVGCSNSCTFTVTVNPLPTLTCPSNSSVCVDAVAYELTGASPSGGTYSGTGVSANNFDPAIAGVGPHTITYSYTDGNGCSNSCTFTVTVNPLPTISCPSDSSVCLNAVSYELTGASPAGGTYSGTGVSANNFDPATAGVGPHTITYTYTDGNGCSNSCTFTVTVNPLPTVSCPSDSSVCVDAAAYELTGASPAGGTYSGTGVSANNFDPATAGVGQHTITYTYTDGDSCSNTCTFTITVNPLPTLTCPSNSSVCVDAVAYELTGASPSGGTYSGTGVSANNFDPATAGVGPHTITYSYTDGNGCSNSCTFTITVNETVVASGTKVDVFCKGGTNGSIDLSVSGGSGSYTYSWNNGESTQDISGLASGTYTVTITESNGCAITGTTSFTIGEPLEVLDASITESTNVDCFGNTNGSATVTATGGTPEYTYLWDDALAQTTATATNLAAGTYHVTVTDANGCTDNATATVIVDDTELPTVITKNIDVELNPTSVSITASDVDNGSHDNCAIQSMSVSPNSFTCANVGPNTVTLTVTDTNGKVNTGTAIVTVKDTIKPVISNMPANKTVNLSGGNCSALVKWNAPSATDNCGVASLLSNDDTFNENGSTLLGIGLHTITYTATDVNGNTETASFTITVIDNIAPTITNCPTNVTVNNDNNICGARVFYVQPNVNDCNGATLTINNNGIDNNSYLSGNIFPVGTTTVIWTATDASGNHSSCSFTVTVIDNQAPVPNVASLPTLNAECSVTVTAPTALDNCDGTITGVSDVDPTFNTAGPHTIVWTYTDSHGKSSSQNQTVNVTSSSPVINTQPVSLTKCEGQPATFSVSATSATGYQWQVDVGGGWGNLNSETNSSLNIASVTNEMNGIHYRVIVKGSCGDIISDEVILTVYGMITVSDQPNQTLCNSSSFTMTQTAPSAGQQGKWTLISGSASITDENSPVTTITAVAVGTSAKVRWTVTNGSCSVSDDVTVTNSILPSVSNQPDQTLCNTSSFTMTQSTPSVGTGVWTLESGIATITSPNSPTTTITGIQGGTSATVRWTVTNVNCSNYDDVTVTNATLAAVSDQPNQTLCNTSSFTITQSAPSLGSGSWSLIGGSANITSPNSPTTTVTGVAVGTSATVRWTVTSGSCISYDDVTLSNTVLPTVSNQPDQTQCNTSTFTMTQSGSGTWSFVGSSGSAIITTPSSPTTTITGVAAGTSVTVRWTVGSGSCIASDDVIVTNNTAAPSVSNQPDQTLCNTSTFTMTQSGSGTWSFVGSSGSAIITTPSSPTTTITGVAVGTNVTVRWTVGSGSCTAYDDVKVTNNSGSSFTASIATSSPDAFCSGLTLTVNPSLAGSYSYLWSPGGATTQSITLYNSATAGTYTVTVTQVGGCGGTAQASYNFQPQNLINDYTILAFNQVDLGNGNYVQSGSVGVTKPLGYAKIGTNSTVAAPGAFVKARFITVQPMSNVPVRIYSAATVVLPNMQVNNTSTTGLADLSIPNNTTVTKTGNYKNVTIGTNCNVTFTTGTIFGTISIGKSSQVKFNANNTGVLNVNSISLADGTDASPTKLLFASDISVRVKTTVSIGKSSMVNPIGGYKAVFFIGGNEFRVLPGGNVTVNASVFAPNGTVKVDGDAAKNTNMKGAYIANYVTSTNKNVFWNQFDCANPTAKTGSIENIVAKEIEPTISPDPFDVKAYPNPSNYQFTLEVEGGSVEKIEVEVYDMGGRHIKHIESDFNQSIVFGEELPTGTYLTIVSQGSNRKALKLIKK